MVKIRVHDISKDIEVPSKDIIECLTKYGVEAKKTMSVLAFEEADVIFEVFTQKYDDGSSLEEYFQIVEPIAPPEPVKTKGKGEQADGSKPEKEADEKDIKSARIVDTRANVVDLEKFNTENIEKLVNELDDRATTSQKIVKKAPTRGKYLKPDENMARFQKQQIVAKKKENIEVLIPDSITVGDLAERLGKSTGEVIKRLMMLGTMSGINDEVDYDTAALVAEDLGAMVQREIIITDEDRLFNDVVDSAESLQTRPPVVVVMGHVDHGKTSLLDTIRNANVTAGEAGGITQHIGAYSVMCNDRKITFLDTPGHAAFTSMRARGAQVTDVAIIVVAADDGIMPQTVEAINHAKAAGVPIIIAINKIDRENANAERVKQELTEYSLVPEEWGGDTICVEVSAIKNIGIDLLLENVLLVADMKELKANPDRLAKGTVVEAKLDKGRGPLATVIVQNGTLKTGDLIVAGMTVGRIRAMVDDKGNKITIAGPSTPVEIVGLAEVPSGGDLFYAVEDERMAKAVVEKRKQKEKDDVFSSNAKMSLDDLFEQINLGVKELVLIVKADVQGSVEAVKQSFEKLDNEEVKVRIIHGGVGAINESDVMLADASNAIIVGFNVRPSPNASATAEARSVEIRTYRIIYEAIEEIEAAMKGMLAPKYKEVITGHAEIRQIFKVSGVGTIAGCYVTDGKIKRNNKIRIVRNGVVIFEGELASLKRFKDDAKEVAESYECGIQVERFNDIKESDVIESFMMEEIAR